MTPREKNLAAIDAIAQEHGYTVEDILGKSRLKRLVYVRRLCVLMLREKGYSTTEIGRVLNRDHSTIVQALKCMQQSAHVSEHTLDEPVDTCNEVV
jgi:chromosomal replication initiation ATPase DnaA